MPKDTKSLGNNKAPACESRGFVRKKKKVCFFDTPSCVKRQLCLAIKTTVFFHKYNYALEEGQLCV